jgi:hypothetical protein
MGKYQEFLTQNKRPGFVVGNAQCIYVYMYINLPQRNNLADHLDTCRTIASTLASGLA